MEYQALILPSQPDSHFRISMLGDGAPSSYMRSFIIILNNSARLVKFTIAFYIYSLYNFTRYNHQERTMKEFPNSSRLLRRKEPAEGSASAKLTQQLRDNGSIGLKLKISGGGNGEHNAGGESTGYTQNYAMFAPFGPIAPKLFVHGRQLFRDRQAADSYYAGNSSADPHAIFTSSAIERIHRLFSPETFEERLMCYTMPQDRLSFGQSMVQMLTKQFAHVDFSDVPTPTADNICEVITAAHKAIEKSGANSGVLLEDQLHPPEDVKQLVRESLKQNMENLFSSQASRLLQEPWQQARALELKDALMHKIADAGGDPEIIVNFMLGLMQPGGNTAPLDELIEHGHQIRTRTILHLLARYMQNPYSERFTEQETRVAKIIATSVQPRVLQHLQRDDIPFIVADAENSRVFDDVIGLPEMGAMGKFEKVTSHDMRLIFRLHCYCRAGAQREAHCPSCTP